MTEWRESISLEETNKIRISLGLKPLTEDAATKGPDAKAEENFKKRKEQEGKERESNALKERIDKARNAKERAKKLAGVGLGEGGDDDLKLSTKAWIKKQKKQAAELAARRAKEQEEMDRIASEAATAYGEKDLEGIKVAHNVQEFEEGDEMVLTLKDQGVLEDGDDELQNVNLAEHEKAAESVALKKKGKQQYTGYDDEEFTGDGKPALLNKYDEFLNGREEVGFKLGGSIQATEQKSLRQIEKEVEERDRLKVKVSLDYTKTIGSDYLQEGDVGFKKSKKKKKRSTRNKEDNADPEEMDVDNAPVAIERQNFDSTNLIDDDDLQASLARTRREQAKAQLRDLKNRAINGMDVDSKPEIKEDDDEGGLVLDDTTEFVRSITLATEQPKPAKVSPSPVQEPSVSPAVSRKQTEEPEQPVGGWGEAREDGEESDSSMKDVAMDKSPYPEDNPEDDDFSGRDLLVRNGLSSTLSILKHQGLLKEISPEQRAIEQAQKERMAWLENRHQLEMKREEERRRLKELGSKMTQAERENENKMIARRNAQEDADAFKSYKPVINLKYHDEHGRDMTPKEAWRHLSHAFHGNKSGAKKAEKHLRKIEEEKKREAMVSGDTPLSTAKAFQARAERVGSATMVLSVGNKGAAPNQEVLLGGERRLSKKNKEKAGKAKPAEKLSVIGDIPMTTTVAQPVSSTPSSSSTPTPRAGFAPVKGFAPISQTSTTPSTYLSGKIERVAIPASLKRKAVNDPPGGPSPKK